MPHPVDIYVGQRLRMRRTLLGMSQEAIGKAIGVTFQQIQKYERGKNRMGSSRLYEFGRTLNVPVGFFFEGYEEPNTESESVIEFSGMKDSATGEFEHEKLISRETLEMMRNYYSIADAKARKRVAELIKAMAG